MTDDSWHMYIGFICGVLVTTIYFMLAAPAHGTQVCLTKKEARALWPKSHIYWYSSDHCWSNRRGGPPRNLRYDLIRENHAQSLPAPISSPADGAGKGDRADVSAPQPKRGTVNPSSVVKIVRAHEFNELDAQADADTFFNAQPFTYQQYVINLNVYRNTSWYQQIWGLAQGVK